MTQEYLTEEKEIDSAIKQIASDVSLYGLDAERVKQIWFSALLQQIADNEIKDQQAH